VTAFVNLLSVLGQNPWVEWRDLIGEVEVAEDRGEDMSEVNDHVGAQAASEDDLVSFRL